jgi:hypothetical protein
LQMEMEMKMKMKMKMVERGEEGRGARAAR